MTAPIDIANRALAQIRAGASIVAFSENSVEANQCSRFYSVARDTALAAYTWAFARRYVAMAQLPDVPPAGFQQAYRLPADCILAVSVKRQDEASMPRRFWGGHQRHDFELASDDDGQIILTDVEQAVLEYTARIENPEAWSVPFQQVVAFLLASYIAIPITGDKQLATTAMNLYKDALEGAKLHSISQHHERPVHVHSGAEARR